MRLWLLVVVACGVPEAPEQPTTERSAVAAAVPEPVTVTEAFDVPPPPGARTVAFELSWQPTLGELVSLRRDAQVLSVDVVDVQPVGARFAVTGYAAEADVEQAVRRSGWTASP